MAAADSFVGDHLNPSPFKQMREKAQELQQRLDQMSRETMWTLKIVRCKLCNEVRNVGTPPRHTEDCPCHPRFLDV